MGGLENRLELRLLTGDMKSILGACRPDWGLRWMAGGLKDTLGRGGFTEGLKGQVHWGVLANRLGLRGQTWDMKRSMGGWKARLGA